VQRRVVRIALLPAAKRFGCKVRLAESATRFGELRVRLELVGICANKAVQPVSSDAADNERFDREALALSRRCLSAVLLRSFKVRNW